jgi:hypothetical protein
MREPARNPVRFGRAGDGRSAGTKASAAAGTRVAVVGIAVALSLEVGARR